MPIQRARIEQLDEIFDVFCQCRLAMESENIFQWNANYPTREIIANDINRREMYCLVREGGVKGAVVINTDQSQQYAAINWQYNDGKIMVIHRLATHPQYQHQGVARQLMDFAEDLAVRNSFSSIRLDAYTGNPRAVKLYESRGYDMRGLVYFPGRELPFHCFEMAV